METITTTPVIELFNIKELADFLKLKPKTIYNDLDAIRRGAAPEDLLPLTLPL